MTSKNIVLVATAKGLIVYEIDSQGSVKHLRSSFIGFSVNMIYVDERTNRWWAGISHKHWGQKLHFSDDTGKSWNEVRSPVYNGALLPNGKVAKLRQLWCMHHGGDDKPNLLWLGTDPGGLFKSEDNGSSWELVESLWHHPSREKEGQWFGAGSDYPFIHSIVLNPEDSDHIYIAVSCAGVFESTDGGLSWKPRNKGLKATYLPNPRVEVGHDPHLLMINQKDPKILWQQNHCGVFYSSDGGNEWLDVSVEDGIPYYGFALATDPHCPEKAWVVPVESDENRVAPDLRLRVFQTNNYGKDWVNVSHGLPDEDVFDIVLRHAFHQKNGLFVFGTTNGNLFYSKGDKIHWSSISTHLTKVNSVIIL